MDRLPAAAAETDDDDDDDDAMLESCSKSAMTFSL